MASCGVAQSWQALEAGERKARCRALAAMVYVFAGPGPASELIRLLRGAEDDVAGLAAVDAALGALPAIPLRRTLSVLARFYRTDQEVA